MTASRWVGLLLIVFGVIGLAYGGITYTKKRHAVDLGPVQVKVDEKESVPIPPLVGGLAIAAGVVVLALGGRRRA